MAYFGPPFQHNRMYLSSFCSLKMHFALTEERLSVTTRAFCQATNVCLSNGNLVGDLLGN